MTTGAVPLVELQINLGVGYAGDPKGKEGLAALTADMLNEGAGDLDATVTGRVYLGTDIHLKVRLADDEAMTVRLQNSETTLVPEEGAAVGLKLEAGAARLLAD